MEIWEPAPHKPQRSVELTSIHVPRDGSCSASPSPWELARSVLVATSSRRPCFFLDCKFAYLLKARCSPYPSEHILLTSDP